MKTFSGAWPALVTPFDDQDRVNVDVLQELTEYLLAKGAAGFYVCGSTGEGIYMSVAERKLVTETVTAQVKGRIPVIAHVGSVAVADAVELARHAQQVGVDGVASIIPPLYRSVESIYGYFAAIGAAVPDLALLTYIFGGPTDAVALMEKLMPIPNVAGSKYTGPNMHEFYQIVKLRDRDWTVFSGMDEQCVFAAMFGASGNIGSTLNFIQGVYSAIHRAVQAGELAQARDLQIRANEVTRVALSFGFPGTLKEMMAMLGFACGQPRLPNLPLPADQRAALRVALEEVEFPALAQM